MASQLKGGKIKIILAYHIFMVKMLNQIFLTFTKSLKDIDFKIELIKEFKYFDINRWDIVLKNGKLIRLPSVNYKDSLKKFLNIYTKDNFKKFNVF